MRVRETSATGGQSQEDKARCIRIRRDMVLGPTRPAPHSDMVVCFVLRNARGSAREPRVSVESKLNPSEVCKRPMPLGRGLVVVQIRVALGILDGKVLVPGWVVG